MSEQIGHTNSDEEIRFQYDKLRAEILHNDILALQQLGFILVLISAAMGFALQENTSTLLRIAVFSAVIIVLYQGMIQTIERTKSTFVIATYLRVFIEDKTQYLKWETRIEAFRKKKPSNLGFSRFVSLVYSYCIIGLGNLVLLAFFFLNEYHKLHEAGKFFYYSGEQQLHFFIECVLVPVSFVFFIFMVYDAIKHHKYVDDNKETFEKTWKEILLQERLQLLREHLQKYKKEKGKAPQQLTDLIDSKSMPEIPDDPLTKKEWQEKRDANGGIEKVQSSAENLSDKLLQYNISDVVLFEDVQFKEKKYKIKQILAKVSSFIKKLKIKLR